ncbi:MAG TPA: DeoR/GlpR family DNA-binding transcription regulator [Gemmataceae bacterium]|nr:DeoR/GlpR family DNA-binding transcription regulator [Gemmataceae bacterium]
MLVEERRQRVLDLISKRGFIALTDLARAVQASESTLRRDLDYWHQQGAVRRTHGGAIYIADGQALPALDERSAAQLEEKRAIARSAVARLNDGEAVLLDGGTTTLETARLLVGRPMQIVTNSLPIAALFANSHETDLVILGGYVYPKTGVALGPLTVRMLDEVHVHQAVLSVGGVTARGLFNSNLLLVETERRMLRSADEVVIVADHTKIGRPALAFLCDFAAVDTFITDAGLAPEQRALLEQSEVRLIVAGETEEQQP